MSLVNFLWQDHSAHDEETAKQVANINPDKLIINVDGPGSDVKNPQCGPSINQLVIFVNQLTKNGFTGTIAMHPDATKGDYEHDWNGKGKLTKRNTTEAWMTYCDYFHEMNQALKTNKLVTFTEILIETESSYIPRTPEMFADIKAYLNKIGENVAISTTGDWNISRSDLKVNYVYPQLYDMGYVSNLLRGENVPSVARAQAVAKGMVNILKTKPAMLNDPHVNFTFSYAGDDVDAPVFGNPKRVWNKKLFGTFIDNFNKELSQYSGSNINTGVWHCSAALSAWNTIASSFGKKVALGAAIIGLLIALYLIAY